MNGPGNNSASRHAAVISLLLVAVWLASCGRAKPAEGAVADCPLYTLYPDSLISAGLTITPAGDNMIVNTPKIAYRAPMVAAAYDGPNAMIMSGSDTLLNYIFNRRPERRDIVYDCFTPYEIYLTEALTDPGRARRVLESRLFAGRVTPIEARAMTWPVVASDCAWSLAAEQVWLATRDRGWLAVTLAATESTLDDDMAVTYDRRKALFRGAAPDMLEGAMPRWFDAADYAALMGLKVNTEHYGAIKLLSTNGFGQYDAYLDSLTEAIETCLWLPDRSRFSETLYSAPYQLQSPVSDNLAQAAAVLTGAASPAASAVLIRSTPTDRAGVTHRVPLSPKGEGVAADDSRLTALTNAYWAAAASRVGNVDAFNASLARVAYQAALDPADIPAFRGAVLRSLFGINPTADGLEIKPFVPHPLGSSHRLTALPYGDALIDIEVIGNGDVISTFALDGEPLDAPVVPADIVGRHAVRITLAGSSDRQTGIDYASLPVMPGMASIDVDGRNIELAAGGAERFAIYVDGHLDRVTDYNALTLRADDGVTAISVAGIGADDVEGLASRQWLYIPSADSVTIDLSNVMRPGTRLIKDKVIAKQMSESSRYKNQRIEFDFNSRLGGDYYLCLIYVDGLGIVNPDYVYALRSIEVNGDDRGVVVLPQLTPDSWRHDLRWWTRQGCTLPLRVTLSQGDNAIAINYFAPDMPDFNHDTNVILPLKALLIRDTRSPRDPFE